MRANMSSLARLLLVLIALSASSAPAEARPLRKLLSLSSGRSLLGNLLNSLTSTASGELAAATAPASGDSSAGVVSSALRGILQPSAAAATSPSGVQLRSAIASAATVAAAALVRDTDMGSQAATLAALQGTAAAVSALSLEAAGLNLVACYDAGIAAARPLQTAGVGQKLTISTSALIASSLCGAVHSAGVPYSQPTGTGLCYSASAGAVQKAAGNSNPFHFVLNNGPGMEGGLYSQIETSLVTGTAGVMNPFNYPAC